MIRLCGFIIKCSAMAGNRIDQTNSSYLSALKSPLKKGFLVFINLLMRIQRELFAKQLPFYLVVEQDTILIV